jgi:hypothetical protein
MRLCKKAGGLHFSANAEKQYFERTLFSLILRSQTIENSVRSKLSFAAVGGGILFTQPHKNFLDSP